MLHLIQMQFRILVFTSFLVGNVIDSVAYAETKVRIEIRVPERRELLHFTDDSIEYDEPPLRKQLSSEVEAEILLRYSDGTEDFVRRTYPSQLSERLFAYVRSPGLEYFKNEEEYRLNALLSSLKSFNPSLIEAHTDWEYENYRPIFKRLHSGRFKAYFPPIKASTWLTLRSQKHLEVPMELNLEPVNSILKGYLGYSTFTPHLSQCLAELGLPPHLLEIEESSSSPHPLFAEEISEKKNERKHLLAGIQKAVDSLTEFKRKFPESKASDQKIAEMIASLHKHENTIWDVENRMKAAPRREGFFETIKKEVLDHLQDPEGLKAVFQRIGSLFYSDKAWVFKTVTLEGPKDLSLFIAMLESAVSLQFDPYETGQVNDCFADLWMKRARFFSEAQAVFLKMVPFSSIGLLSKLIVISKNDPEFQEKLIFALARRIEQSWKLHPEEADLLKNFFERDKEKGGIILDPIKGRAALFDAVLVLPSPRRIEFLALFELYDQIDPKYL